MALSFTTILINTLLFACPLLLLCTGGILNTRAGIVNFGFDGIMCVGAALYCIIVSQLKNSAGSGIAIFAFLVAVVVGLIFGVLHSLATLVCQANQFLISMVINYFGYALAVVLPIAFTGTIQYSLASVYIPLFPILAILLTLLAIYVFAIILFLTKLGLYIRAIGQNPTAVALNYIPVRRSRFYISLFSSSLACFAGALFVYILPSIFITTNNFSGLGFLAMALLMMTRSRFFLTTILCLLFAFLYEIGNTSQTFIVITNNTPDWLWGMLPYFITLLTLMIFRPDTSLPPSWGIPYIREGKQWQ